MDDFISHYLNYIGETECPMIYHRWCCISLLGAYLGRQYTLQFGEFIINPNMYVMLMGVPAARKSTAIKIAKKIITKAGYNKISADKTSKEKFLEDLAESNSPNSIDDILEQNIFGEASNAKPSEMYIACDEFNDFIGEGNSGFISLLGNLWDYQGSYENKIKNGKSVNIPEPTISILGGNTAVNFARAFPPEILSQGFFSRLLLIHGKPTGKRITFPRVPSEESRNKLIDHLKKIKENVTGLISVTGSAEIVLDHIYQNYKPLFDNRFEYYGGRRFTHLLKLCLIIAAAYCSNTIEEEHVLVANTILTFTEHHMPSAIGEFGQSKNSDISHKVMQILLDTDKPLDLRDLWALLHTDLDRINSLVDILRNLETANKIFSTNIGFLAKSKIAREKEEDVVDYSILTEEERNMK